MAMVFVYRSSQQEVQVAMIHGLHRAFTWGSGENVYGDGYVIVHLIPFNSIQFDWIRLDSSHNFILCP